MRRQPIVPPDITPAIAAFCADVAPGQAPGYVAVRPAGDALVGDSFENVSSQIDRAGGGEETGWAIYLYPGFYLQAELFSMWRAPDGTLVDVTPSWPGETRTLFVQLPEARGDIDVNAIRRAIDGDADVEAYLACLAELEDMDRRHGEERAAQLIGVLTGQAVTVPTPSRDALEARLVRMTALQARLTTLHDLIEARMGRYDPYAPCWCGSGRKAKWCHKEATAHAR